MELKKVAGDAHPEAARLSSEISQLQQVAREQCTQLKEAVAQQAQYEADLEELTSAIAVAQDKLLASPVNPSDVSSLKKQISEHNVCTCLTLTHKSGTPRLGCLLLFICSGPNMI